MNISLGDADIFVAEYLLCEHNAMFLGQDCRETMS